MDKMKQPNKNKENSNTDSTSPDRKKDKQITQEEKLSKIQIKSIERDCLIRVFNLLADLQKEDSSDEESKKKKYLKEIEVRANEKKMKSPVNNFISKTSKISSKNTTTNKVYKEDEN